MIKNKNIAINKYAGIALATLLLVGCGKRCPTLRELYEKEGIGDTCVVNQIGCNSQINDAKHVGFRQIKGGYSYGVLVTRQDEYGTPNPNWDTDINDTVIAGFNPITRQYAIYRNLTKEK